jgi:hypothetical protein
MRKIGLILLAIIATASMAMVLGCGGGGGGGGSTTTFNGVIREVESGNDNPVAGATVQLWMDGLVLEDSDTSDAFGNFTLVGSDVVGQAVFFKIDGPGAVPLNTHLRIVPDVTVFPGSIDLPLISENVALGVGSAVWGISEPSWNSTVQAEAYVVFEVNEFGVEDTTPGGVTVLKTGAAGAVLDSSNIYYNDGNDIFATTNMTAQSNSMTGLPDAAAKIPEIDAGIKYSFATTNHPNGDIGTFDAYLIAGEITLVNLEP